MSDSYIMNGFKNAEAAATPEEITEAALLGFRLFRFGDAGVDLKDKWILYGYGLVYPTARAAIDAYINATQEEHGAAPKYTWLRII